MVLKLPTYICEWYIQYLYIFSYFLDIEYIWRHWEIEWNGKRTWEFKFISGIGILECGSRGKKPDSVCNGLLKWEPNMGVWIEWELNMGVWIEWELNMGVWIEWKLNMGVWIEWELNMGVWIEWKLNMGVWIEWELNMGVWIEWELNMGVWIEWELNMGFRLNVN